MCVLFAVQTTVRVLADSASQLGMFERRGAIFGLRAVIEILPTVALECVSTPAAAAAAAAAVFVAGCSC